MLFRQRFDYTFRMLKRFIHAVPAVSVLAMAAASQAQLQPTTQEQFDGCVQILRRGVPTPTSAGDITILGALRELGDPSLKPFWFQLAQKDRWEAQVHAVLALSELTPENPADAWMIAQLKSVDAQRAVVATLLDRESLTVAQTRQLLDAEVLDPVTELWLISDLVSRGEAVDKAKLREIAGSDDLDLQGLATCLLAQLGDESQFVPHTARLGMLPADRRDLHLMELFIAIEQYKLTASLPWMRKIIEDVPVERQVKWQAVRCMLTLSPSEGIALWRKTAAGVTSDGEWVRAVLLLLDAGADVPASTYAAVPRENELLAALATLGEAISNGQPLAQPLKTIIDYGQLGSARWALGRTEKLSLDEARDVLVHVIDGIMTQRYGRDERADMAVIASTILYKMDATAALEHLLKVEDDSMTQEVMLLGLLSCKGDDISAAAAKLRRIGHSRADSMTLMLMAKHAKSLAATELKQLGVIAAGGGRLSPALQAQAAWLYLKHSGKIEQALNRIFVKE